MKERILLIEDNNEIRENTAEILELSAYIVDTAENGKIGIEKALLQKPDLIICDIMMPVLDGYGVLHLLGKNEKLAGIPLIFLTAKSERSDFRKGMEMGADDYITKPFTDIELLSAIESRLKKQKIKDTNFAPTPEGMTEMLSAFGEKKTLESILNNSEEVSFQKKQLVYREGNRPHMLYFLKSGKVKTFISNDDGKVLTNSLLGEGDFFGYTALLEDAAYHESAEVIDDALIVTVPADEFRLLLQSNAEVSKKIIQLLSKNIREQEEKLLSIAYNSLRKRVASALVTLANKYEPGEENPSISFSREDLANIAGTATESLIRTLSDFKSESLISIAGTSIQLLNMKKLTSMIN